jgi:hypothetical protein
VASSGGAFQPPTRPSLPARAFGLTAPFVSFFSLCGSHATALSPTVLGRRQAWSNVARPTTKQQPAAYPGYEGRSATQWSKQNLSGPDAGAFTENRVEKYVQSPSITKSTYSRTIQDFTSAITKDTTNNRNDINSLPSLLAGIIQSPLPHDLRTRQCIKNSSFATYHSPPDGRRTEHQEDAV